MRTAFTMLIAVGLVGIGLLLMIRGQYFSGGIFLLGSAAIVLPALNGRGLGSVGDAYRLMSFVRNPLVTAITSAVEHFGAKDDGKARPKLGEIKPTSAFDADAAIARYMEQRDPELGAVATPPPPIRGFGRKQV